MNVVDTPLEGLKVATTQPFMDARGAFSRLFCEQALAPALQGRRIVQVNHSLTHQVGAVRGLHFQRAPHEEMKFVRCLRGRIWDVAVDLRMDSPTFLRWHAEELTPDGGAMLVIPEGFAHGFQTLAPDSELLYLHTAFHEPTAEGGLRHDDPRLGIRWPLEVRDLSARDLKHPLLGESVVGVPK